MADVVFGYVYDFGTGEEWVARRGAGVLLNGRPAPAPPGERHDENGRLEIVAIESADPRWIAAAAADLAEVAHRFRALGTIAVALCQLAATRVDGFVTLWRTRAVDVAAAPLPAPEAVDRQLWAEINLAGMRKMLDPVIERLESRRSGLLGGPLRAAAGTMLALEVGGLTGLLSQRVLGQYELVLLDPD